MIKKTINSFYKRFYGMPGIISFIVKGFHRLYYYTENRTWQNTYWLGTPVSKCPLDLWIYQEIIYELRPDVIIECGTNRGGSASFLASMFDLVGNGRVITIDVEEFENRPSHERVTYLKGSSTSDDIVNQVRDSIADGEKVLVLLDSDHSMKHVLEELRLYSEFVTPGSYLVVEDSNINGYPVSPHVGPGPMEAIGSFLSENREYIVDHNKEKFYLTFNPNGFLQRVK